MGNNTIGNICKIFSAVLLVAALIFAFNEGFVYFIAALPGCLFFLAIGEIVEHLDAISSNTFALYLQMGKKPKASDTWFCKRCGIGNSSDAASCKNCGTEKQ